MNPRSRLLTAVVVSCVVAAALGFYVVMRESPEAARSRLLIDVLLLASLAGTVFVVTRSPLERREELLDAMRALARGVRDRRLEHERFGDLGDIARSYNEVAAALCEHEDPNLGPVKAKRRQDRPAWMDPDASEHPELGEVRVIAKKEKAAPTKKAEQRAAKAKAKAKAKDEPAGSAWDRKSEAASAAKSEAPANANADADVDVDERPTSERPRRADSAPPAKAARAEADADERPEEDDERVVEEPAPVRAEADGAAEPDDVVSEDEGANGAADNDTAIDDLLARSQPPHTAEANEEPRATPAETLPPFDMRALFREFVEAKRAHDEDTDDLEFEAFAETLEDEMSRLVEAHACRAVRFEVRVQDGEVSLLPRLLR